MLLRLILYEALLKIMLQVKIFHLPVCRVLFLVVTHLKMKGQDLIGKKHTANYTQSLGERLDALNFYLFICGINRMVALLLCYNAIDLCASKDVSASAIYLLGSI